jgi:hypothetical protein
MAQQSPAAETMRKEAARALEVAGEQIALALRESQPQVDALGESLQRLAMALGRDGGISAAETTALNSLMMQAVARLQFYDRMTQHLTHVREYLARSARNMGGAEPSHGWTGVHQQLSERLLSDTQRFHLGKNFAEGPLAAEPAKRGPGRGTPGGDIDLF